MEPPSKSLTRREDAGAQTLDLLVGARRYNQWLFDRVQAALGQRVLEAVFGAARMPVFLVGRDLLVTVDVIDDYVRGVRERFRDRANVPVRLLDLTESLGHLPQFGFDSAVSINVFEH